MTTDDLDIATIAGGCFWCIEAAFKELAGIESVTSGYAGGETENPTYEEVCTGETGHAEAVQLAYDPDVLGYEDVLKVFFTVHDPTTLNRQGPDVGTQYRSAIFYHGEAQRELAESFVAELEAEGAFEDPIVTEIEPLEVFYEAEDYHQDYYEKNPNNPYCQFNAQPKIEKVRTKFAEQIKASR